MTEDFSQNPNAENPEALIGLRIDEPKTTAAGIPAVISSIKHVLDEMNIPRAISALKALNQKDGFDCPGCAWPDPDDERSSLGEFCENGAKAIAEEATSKRIASDFFVKHSVKELSVLKVYEIGKKGNIIETIY